MLLVHSAAQSYNPSIYANLPYDTVKDFVDIAALGGQPNVLVVAPSSGVKSVAELIALAKQKPGQLNFASAGNGSGTHINGEKFKLAAGIDVVHIPYKARRRRYRHHRGGSRILSPISAALPSCATASSWRLRSARTSARARCPTPTIAQSGLPGSTTRCGSAFRAGRHAPEVVDRSRATWLTAQSADARGCRAGRRADAMTPPEFKQFVDTENTESGKVIKAAGIKVQ